MKVHLMPSREELMILMKRKQKRFNLLMKIDLPSLNQSELNEKECKTGQKTTKHFKNYSPVNPVNKTSFGTIPNRKRKRAKKGESPYSSHFIGSSKEIRHQTITSGDEGLNPSPMAKTNNKDLRILILAQSNLIWNLAYKHKINEAIKRIRLLSKEIEEE